MDTEENKTPNATIHALRPVLPINVKAISGSVFGTAILSTIAIFITTALLGTVMLVISAMGSMFGILFGLSLLGTGAIFAVTASTAFFPLLALSGGLIGLKRSRMGLRRLYGTKPLGDNSTTLTERVNAIAAVSGLNKMPDIGVYREDEINAFAAGTRKNSLVAFTTKALDSLSQQELDAIIAHEIGHIVYNDTAKLAFMRSFQETLTSLLFFYGLKLWTRRTVFLLTELLMLKISRDREYRADAFAAAILGKNPVIAMLSLLENNSESDTSAQKGYRMFQMWGPGKHLFSTHPPIKARIRAIEQDTYIRHIPKLKPKKVEAGVV